MMNREPLLVVASLPIFTLVLAPVASATIVIDDFVSVQTTIDSVGGSAAFNTAPSPPGQILGGERDVRVQVASGIGNISMLINAFGADLLTYNEDALTNGDARITWDGVDGSEALDATGLGGIDFTEGGLNSAFEIQGVTTDLPVDLTFFAYTNATDFSSFLISLPALILVPQTFVVPFGSFGVAGGSGADFTNIGAFRMAIDTNGGNAVDMTLDAIVIRTPVPEPTTLFLMMGGLLALVGGSASPRVRRR